MAFQKICEGIYEIHMSKVAGFVGFLLALWEPYFSERAEFP
jgi:hypothetical protein